MREHKGTVLQYDIVELERCIRIADKNHDWQLAKRLAQALAAAKESLQNFQQEQAEESYNRFQEKAEQLASKYIITRR